MEIHLEVHPTKQLDGWDDVNHKLNSRTLFKSRAATRRLGFPLKMEDGAVKVIVGKKRARTSSSGIMSNLEMNYGIPTKYVEH